MYNSIITLFLLLTFCLQLNAQINTQEIPFGKKHKLEYTESEIISIIPDTEFIRKKKAEVGKFPDFAGISIPVGISFSHHAKKITLTPDTVIWQIHLHIPGSVGAGIVFSDFEIPDDGKLFIYDRDKDFYIGAFTRENNHETGIFSVQPLPSENIVIEYYAPNINQHTLPTFKVDEIIYIMNSPDQQLNLFKEINKEVESDDCFVNINCPEGSLWQKQKRGISRILLREGTEWFYCTGTLVNNTLEDGTPYILTADHCGEESSDADLLVWQFLFNYEFNTCSGQTSNPSANNVITGSGLLSKGPLSGGSDFKLLVLSSSLPASWRPYFNGWSRLGGNPSSGVGIHHPYGYPKKISTYESPLFNATFPGGMLSGFWRVVWAETETGHSVTERGSSGSPLFDSNGLVVGTLSGGSSGCEDLTLPDIYGKFNRHWMANGTNPDETLNSWLDPTGENPQVLYGYDPGLATNFVSLSIKPENSGVVSGSGYFAQGETVTIAATPNEEYLFINWTDENNNQVSINPEYIFTMPSTEKTLTANFRLSQTTNDDIVIGENFFVFPNPVENLITIKSDLPFDSLSYSFYNLNGQLVLESNNYTEHANNLIHIDLLGFQNGWYIMQIMLNEKIITHKFFVYR
jgi:hypothetical protein